MQIELIYIKTDQIIVIYYKKLCTFVLKNIPSVGLFIISKPD